MNSIYAAVLAHSSALPHAHHGDSTNWLPALLALGGVAVVLFVAARARAARKTRR